MFTVIPLTWFKNLISTCFGSKIILPKWDATSFQHLISHSTKRGTPNLLAGPSHWWTINVSGGTTLNKTTTLPLQCWGKLDNWVHSIKVTGPVSSNEANEKPLHEVVQNHPKSQKKILSPSMEFLALFLVFWIKIISNSNGVMGISCQINANMPMPICCVR